jgi:hypothetical protein
MMACDAGIIPIVMNGRSEVLDLGRATRTWTRAQRNAAKIRAGGQCEAPKCQTPIERCDLHHEDHWPEAAVLISPTGSTCARTTTGSPTTRPGPSLATKPAKLKSEERDAWDGTEPR